MRLIVFFIAALLLGRDSFAQASKKVPNAFPSKHTSHNGKTNHQSVNKKKLTKIYSDAIAQYVLQTKKKYVISFDTLFFGKHVYGQPDDFPDINLPEKIENTHIRLITPDEGKRKQAQSTSAIYINMVGWVEHKKAEFIFVTFSNGGRHQFDFFINYVFDVSHGDYQFVETRFEDFEKKE